MTENTDTRLAKVEQRQEDHEKSCHERYHRIDSGISSLQLDLKKVLLAIIGTLGSILITAAGVWLQHIGAA